MLLATLLSAAQPGGPPPAGAEDCAPRMNMTAGGPPPPIFHAERIEAGADRGVTLSAHRCGGEDIRIERHRTEPDAAGRDLEWVPVSRCAAIGSWLEAAGRLRLPTPMLRPHRDMTGPRRGTWFTLEARFVTGPGWHAPLRLSILEPPEVPPDALSGWFRDGERVFQACRDRGHGGAGYAPGPGRPRL